MIEDEIVLFLLFIYVFFSSWRSIPRRLWKSWEHRTISWQITPTPIYTSMSIDTEIETFNLITMRMQLLGIIYIKLHVVFLQHTLWISGVWWLLSGKWPLLGVQQSRSSLLREWNTPSQNGHILLKSTQAVKLIKIFLHTSKFQRGRLKERWIWKPTAKCKTLSINCVT